MVDSQFSMAMELPIEMVSPNLSRKSDGTKPYPTRPWYLKVLPPQTVSFTTGRSLVPLPLLNLSAGEALVEATNKAERRMVWERYMAAQESEGEKRGAETDNLHKYAGSLPSPWILYLYQPIVGDIWVVREETSAAKCGTHVGNTMAKRSREICFMQVAILVGMHVQSDILWNTGGEVRSTRKKTKMLFSCRDSSARKVSCPYFPSKEATCWYHSSLSEITRDGSW